jgi:ferritin-like protein
MLFSNLITNHDDLCSGANPAEAFGLIDGKEEKAKLMDIMLDAAAEIKVEDYLCTLLHYAVAQCNSGTITKILIRGADIMMEDSKRRLPFEVAIANENSKFLIITKHVQILDLDSSTDMKNCMII